MAKKKRVVTKKTTQKVTMKSVRIPPLEVSEAILILVGTAPLLVSNKMNVAEEIALVYGDPAGKSGSAQQVTKVTPAEAYRRAFYVMPYSKYDAPSPKAKYGIPASGIQKCFVAAIRSTGVNNPTTFGVIRDSFQVGAQAGGLCEISYSSFEMDKRAAGIGKGNKTPDMRYRPMFHDWKCRAKFRFNPRVMTIEQLVNLGMHAGFYIGWGEMRAQKQQGECGGFKVETAPS